MFAGEAVTELWPPPPPSLLPDGLDEIPPGPELGAVLAGIDLDGLPGFDLVVVMAAQARMVSFHQAELLATVARVGDASSEASGLVSDDDGEFAADEIRAALCLTRRAATLLLELAWEFSRLPQLAAALRCGLIDLPRARVVCTELASLDDQQAQEVVTQLSWSGRELRPPVSWGPGCAAWCSPWTPPQPRSATSGEWRGGGWSCRPTPTAPPTSSPTRSPPNGPTSPTTGSTTSPWRPRDQTTPAASTRCEPTSSWTSWTPAPVPPAAGVIDLRVDLATLTQLAENPGEIPGYGPVIADVARQVAATQVGSQWRVTVTHPDSGAVAWNGTTKRRPSAAQRRHVRGAVSHLCVPRVPDARHPLPGPLPTVRRPRVAWLRRPRFRGSPRLLGDHPDRRLIGPSHILLGLGQSVVALDDGGGRGMPLLLVEEVEQAPSNRL